MAREIRPAWASRVRQLRGEHGWAQQELALRVGLSRPEVSAIETGRVVPSVKAALALGRALGASVEELFGLDAAVGIEWAWAPRAFPCRVWLVDVGERRLAFPCEGGLMGLVPHDAVVHDRLLPATLQGPPTLVIAGCDPAAGLLAEALRARGVRTLLVVRSSGRALELLQAGLVHCAGVHLACRRRSDNARAVRQRLGKGYALIRWAVWETGVAIAPGLSKRAIDTARLSRLRWVGRDPGSGARQSMDELFRGLAGPRVPLVASDHREVAQAIRLGAAQAGVCIRVAADEAGLDFLPLHPEPYDLCFRTSMQRDPTLNALLDTLGDRALQRQLGDLPGYQTKTCGQRVFVS